MMPTLPPQTVLAIVQQQHPDPGSILGPHPWPGGTQPAWVVRVYAPEAVAAGILFPHHGQEIPLHPVHHPHFFETIFRVAGAVPDPDRPPAPSLGEDWPLAPADWLNYQITAQTPQGERQIFYDPYQFSRLGWSDDDRRLFLAGQHHRLYGKMGAHLGQVDGVAGVHFALWAPGALGVEVVGDFNQWQSQQHPMEPMGGGVWERFIPGVQPGDRYQYYIHTAKGSLYKKSDPFGFSHEVRPRTASRVTSLQGYPWGDRTWMHQRRQSNPLTQAIAVYEVHLGSWMHAATSDPPQGIPGGDRPPPPPVPISGYRPRARFLSYEELAHRLIPYVRDLGYTHVELMPLAEHPFDGSWGYQVTGYYAPTSRFGDPQGLMYFIDQCHQQGLGVILDWVPGHFSKDEHGLAEFDGTPLYEHPDPRQGEQPEWGTLVFHYDRPEVRNFLIANALFWLDYYHIDGLRVDAVTAMLYLDYGRKSGEWLPNAHGGHENLEAAQFLRDLHQVITAHHPGVLSIAEESSLWPSVTGPTYLGGLGFSLKWNLGWSHDILDYFRMEPPARQFHQHNVTFPMWYHPHENFMLVLSHDEAGGGQGSILSQMPGDEWQKLAHLRCLCTFMYTHPGKKTTFMGLELGQWEEWNVWGQLSWHLLEHKSHQAIHHFFRDLNGLYRSQPALYTQDFQEAGFAWIDHHDSRHSVISFLRRSPEAEDFLMVVCNFTPQPHAHYRIGVPEPGFYRERFNSDSREYGGSNLGNLGGKWAEEWPFHSQPYSLDLCLPPLGVLVFGVDRLTPPESPPLAANWG